MNTYTAIPLIIILYTDDKVSSVVPYIYTFVFEWPPVGCHFTNTFDAQKMEHLSVYHGIRAI